jgi:hypothetical protein
MFRPDEVIGALFTRVGWQQPTEDEYDILEGDNLVSSSGLYFNNYHPAVTVRNLKETNQDAGISNADFNTKLEDFQKSAINRVCQGIFNKDVIIEQVQLYSRDYERNFKTLDNTSKFVGFKIKLCDDYGYSVLLNAISLYFDGVATFNMYCFHSAKGNVWTKSVTTVANTETVVNVTDLVLSISKNTQKGGVYYIGYFQDDLGAVNAINDYGADYEDANIFSYSGIEADTLTASTYDNQTIVQTALNYGVNLELTSVNDYTSMIVRNAQAFDEAVALQVACDCIEQIIMSTRSNYTERMTKEFAQQLYNDLNLEWTTESQPYTGGLKNRLRRELQRLNKNFFKEDRPVIIMS